MERGVKYIYDEKEEERERKDRSIDRSCLLLCGWKRDTSGSRTRGRRLFVLETTSGYAKCNVINRARVSKMSVEDRPQFSYFSLIYLKQYIYTKLF